MYKAIAVLTTILVVIGSSLVFAADVNAPADTTTAPAATSLTSVINSIDVAGAISSLKSKAVNAGFFYDIRWHQFNHCYTYSLPLTLAKAPWWDIATVGYASNGELIGGTGVRVQPMKVLNKIGLVLPTGWIAVDNYLNNATIHASFNGGIKSIGSGNKFGYGPVVAIEIKL